ncbi:hypothetical protein F8388_026600 [Cannabis sativa]|uniref:HAT C-terminal dimerisation domain-containing protein n=1 Tax=Cannabis sativa TaxID=3483 RepID=A0A7J6EC10_CANSA|nr:hypothetical protein F8388_026600 [Cannabis sativa]
MRILGLICSISTCERNWSVLNKVHAKKRNRLTTARMNTLLYIMYNRKLKHNFLKKQSGSVEYDPLIVENVSSDDEWVANPNDEEDGDSRVIEIEGVVQIEDESRSSRATRKKKQIMHQRKVTFRTHCNYVVTRNGKNIQVDLDEEDEDEFEGAKNDDGDNDRAIQYNDFS